MLSTSSSLDKTNYSPFNRAFPCCQIQQRQKVQWEFLVFGDKHFQFLLPVFHSCYSVMLSSIRFNTTWFATSFILATTKMWSNLPRAVVESANHQMYRRGANSLLLSADISWIWVHWFTCLFPHIYLSHFPMTCLSLQADFTLELFEFIVCWLCPKGFQLKVQRKKVSNCSQQLLLQFMGDEVHGILVVCTCSFLELF